MDKKQQQETRRLPGFYIALCCCVLAIGVAGYFTERHEQMKQKEASAPAEVEDVIYSADEITSTPYVNEAALPFEGSAQKYEDTLTETPQEESAEVSANADYVEETKDSITFDNPDFQETAFIVNAEDTVFKMPVNGTVLQDYSDELVYNAALGDWRTHDGIDIACDVGCSVSAAADGKVESIKEDAYGISVVIDHNNGYKTVYCQLEGTEDISEGSEVSAGDVIGTVGESKGESTDKPHLHFEIYQNDECIDPKSVL